MDPIKKIIKRPKELITKKELLRETFNLSKKPIKFIVIGGLALFILIPILTYLYFIRDLTSKDKIINRNNEGVILYDRNDVPFFTFYEARTKNSVPFDQIPQTVKDATVAMEDREFYEHQGFSPRGFARAVRENLLNEALIQGGSTITQQLVKNTLLSSDRNFLRKYQELILALEVDRRFSKDDILEMYLNTTYFGEGAFGIEDASRAYFGKNANELSLGESAMLVGLLPAPSRYSPLSGSLDLANRRQSLVLDQLEAQGYISEEQKEQALRENIVFNPISEEINVQAPHFALMVKDELIKKYGEQRVAGSGFNVKTTIDLTKQQFMQETVKNQVQRLLRNNATNGAAVALDPKTGEIIALVGSHNWFDEDNGKINMAVRPRQPGSSFKPIIYAAAFAEKIITPATELSDKEITFPGGYKPRNYDNRFRGEVLARFALANSLNIPAVHVMDRVGVQQGIQFAKQLGITTLSDETDYGLPLVLGSGEVPLTEMVRAFAAFANKGEQPVITTVLEVKDKNDRVIDTHTPEIKRVISEGVAFLISSILSDNRARQETFGSSLTISRPAAVKTGTTEDYRDALTVGYTPSLVVGVWVGNNDNTPMDSVAGSLGAAPIWRLIMENFLRGTVVEPFRKPFGVIEQNVCRENGFKAEVATSSAYPEFFLSGTLPRELCTNASNPTPTDEPTPTEVQEEEENTPTPTQVQEENPVPPTSTPTLIQSPTPTPILEVLPTL